MRRGASYLLMLLGVAACVLAVALWWPHLDGGVVAAVAGAPVALPLHALGAILFSLGAGALYSRPMVPLYFVLSLVLPLLGVVTVVALNAILVWGRGASADDDDLEVGNPILSTIRPGVAEVHLKPASRLMRERGAGSIGRLILGLSKSGGAGRGYQVLRRYQQDADVELQFYAQSAQRNSTEGLEIQLKKLTSELAGDSENGQVRGALAEVLIVLAAQRTTSGSDTHAYVRRALEHLKQLPESSGRAALEVRGNLLVREPAAARAALQKLPDRDRRKPALEAEVLYAERDWARLSEFAEVLETGDIQLRTARQFWRKSA